MVSAGTRVLKQRYRLRRLLGRVISYLLVWLMAFFFLFPILWMIFTAFKPTTDVSRFPLQLLPHDVKMVEVEGQLYPLYVVREPGKPPRTMARIKVAQGQATFVDPANPADVLETRNRYGEPVLTVKFEWHNFVDAMYRGSRPGLHVNFWTYLKNSSVIAILAIIGTLVSSTPAAYGFSRIQWPGREKLFLVLLATMMLPFQVTMIPLYLFFTEFLHWGDSNLPIVVPTFFGSAFDIFLLRQFFRGIPEEMLDAARVDGASEFRIFYNIVLPLSKPVLATITIFTFLWAWNDFLGPLLYLNNPEHFTLALGLQDYQGQRNVAWNQLMAASVVFTLPIVILFFFAQRTFIEGIKLTGTKG
ncbi:MAG: carbohydrate ABC transporter permease [Caldilineae bacterium]|nr:MAG: carbohydrate ABC transporter permease [Caldilineae bacterium]